ncbi:hypothetical protein BCR43DRAFT_484598 [Syncephalastrum racemosum]|uniref:Uncharacterized protein n=1 Tax=Syncephalastrum racemosum TaxID=13706 RepID=A0A1X2HKU6_SYNRA|nr:hypothetical protein BCR43DRAFT_484598 [Syncephalastrum racemosum]
MDNNDNNNNNNSRNTDSLSPPPLPPRQRRLSASSSSSVLSKLNRPRSSSDVSVENHNDASSSARKPDPKVDEMEQYYAHLHKHVREMKRTKPKDLAKPTIEAFETRDADGQTHTEWRAFIEAWVQYVLNSFASSRIDDRLEPFSLNIIKSGVDRLYTMVLPFKEPALRVRRIYRWENRWLTGAILLVRN